MLFVIIEYQKFLVALYYVTNNYRKFKKNKNKSQSISNRSY